MEATVILREKPCRIRLRTRKGRPQVRRTQRLEQSGAHAVKTAALDNAAWSVYRVRVPW